MEFVPYRLIRNQPKELRKKLKERGELVVTVDGEPMAIMLQVPKGNLDELVLLISQIRAQMAVASIRENARKGGQADLAEQEIEAVIQEVRESRPK